MGLLIHGSHVSISCMDLMHGSHAWISCMGIYMGLCMMDLMHGSIHGSMHRSMHDGSSSCCKMLVWYDDVAVDPWIDLSIDPIHV